MRKLFIGVMCLASLPVLANYTCSIEKFGQRHIGKGQTKIEAMVKSRIACTKLNNAMFCSMANSKCKQEREIEKQKHYCEIEASGKLHYSIKRNLADAKEEAIEDCLDSNALMFCRENKVKCYKL